jgi:hypothetical protein
MNPNINTQARRCGYPPLVDARERTGRNLTMQVKAGQFIVREVTKIHANGSCDLLDLTGWQSREGCADFLRGL